MIAFATRLKKIRNEYQVTQDMLAKAIDSDNSVISRYETNTISPSIDVLCAIADYFDVTTDYLLGRSQFPSKEERLKQCEKATALLEFVTDLYGDDMASANKLKIEVE